MKLTNMVLLYWCCILSTTIRLYIFRINAFNSISASDSVNGATNLKHVHNTVANDDIKKNGSSARLGVTSWQSREKHLKSSERAPPFKLVIFDKDGTLVCFHSMWAPWCTNIANKLQSLVEFDVIHDVYKLYNFNPSSEKIGKGSLAEDTHDILRNNLLRMLVEKHGVEEKVAEDVVEKVWRESNTIAPCVKATCDVRSLFEKLKSSGIKIAICTSDDRINTIYGLNALGVTSLADYILCGDDPQNVAKPAPHNVHHICQKLGVSTTETVVVGDTPADTGMGRGSGAALVVGVLTGVCMAEDLFSQADMILENIEGLLPHVLPSHNHGEKIHGQL